MFSSSTCLVLLPRESLFHLDFILLCDVKNESDFVFFSKCLSCFPISTYYEVRPSPLDLRRHLSFVSNFQLEVISLGDVLTFWRGSEPGPWAQRKTLHTE